jgi:hypothetical protein
VPLFEDERQHIPDQEKVEEIEHVAKVRRGDDPPLVPGQLLLTFQIFYHPPLPLQVRSAPLLL